MYTIWFNNSFVFSLVFLVTYHILSIKKRKRKRDRKVTLILYQLFSVCTNFVVDDNGEIDSLFFSAGR